MADPTAGRDAPGKLPLAAFFWLAGLTFAWGMGWPVMKVVVSELPIFSFRMLSSLSAGVCVLLLARAMGQPLLPHRDEYRATAITGVFNITGWFCFTALGLTLLPAGRSVVLAYTMPLWSVLAARIMVGDPITRTKLLGLAFGLGAIALLLGDNLIRLGGAPLGVLAVLGAAISWAIGTVLQKRAWKTPLLTLAGWQLLIGGTPITIMALAFDSDAFARVTPLGIAGVAYVVVVATLFGYWAWFTIVRLMPTNVASLAVLPVPLVGVASSALVLGEPLGWPEAGALALVTAALATVLPLPKPAWLRFRAGGKRANLEGGKTHGRDGQ